MHFSIIEELWLGNDDDERARTQAAESMAAMITKVHGLRPLPLAAERLLTLTRRPDPPLAEITNVLEGDAALATRVLRLVNSAAFALRESCKGVRHAVVLLGAVQLGELAMAAAILGAFAGGSPAASAILERAPRAAALARHLSDRAGADPDDAYTCALVHEIGKLSLLDAGDEGYGKLLEWYAGDQLAAAERAAYGFDHGVLGAHLLGLWKIPQPVPQVIGWQTQLGRAHDAGGEILGLVHVVRVASRLASALDAIDPDPSLIDALLQDPSMASLGLDRDEIVDLWPELRLARGDARGAAPDLPREVLVRLSGRAPSRVSGGVSLNAARVSGRTMTMPPRGSLIQEVPESLTALSAPAPRSREERRFLAQRAVLTAFTAGMTAMGGWGLAHPELPLTRNVIIAGALSGLCAMIAHGWARGREGRTRKVRRSYGSRLLRND